MDPAKISGPTISRDSGNSLFPGILRVSPIQQVINRHALDSVLIVEVSKIHHCAFKSSRRLSNILRKRFDIIKRRQQKHNVPSLELRRAQKGRTPEIIPHSPLQISSLKQTFHNLAMTTLRSKMQRRNTIQKLTINRRASPKQNPNDLLTSLITRIMQRRPATITAGLNSRIMLQKQRNNIRTIVRRRNMQRSLPSSFHSIDLSPGSSIPAPSTSQQQLCHAPIARRTGPMERCPTEFILCFEPRHFTSRAKQ